MPTCCVSCIASQWSLSTTSPNTGRDTAYLIAAALFIMGIKRLRSPKTARVGNGLAALGMLVASAATLASASSSTLALILSALALGTAAGAFFATRVQMTQMPQMVAVFNGFGGAASAAVAIGEFAQGAGHRPMHLALIGVSVLLGAATLSGSCIAAGKLHGVVPGRPIVPPMQFFINASGLLVSFGLVAAAAFGWMDTGWAIGALVVVALGVGLALTLPIGGADMPVMVSLLNSYSGLAAAAAGFAIDNKALIVSGALVGASGLILTSIMCKAMNRSLSNVLFAGVGSGASQGSSGAQGPDARPYRSSSPEDMAILLDAAQRVLVVPGYGMAVAQAQHAVKDLAAALAKRGCTVVYGVHPVAGRMPGHMNVLLAEADVPYEQLVDLESANAQVGQCDAALVIGANDVVNPAARDDPKSPIAGMPIIEVDRAQTVFVLKRSMGAGYAGVGNALFYNENTLMVFGDAKGTVESTISSLASL